MLLIINLSVNVMILILYQAHHHLRIIAVKNFRINGLDETNIRFA